MSMGLGAQVCTIRLLGDRGICAAPVGSYLRVVFSSLKQRCPSPLWTGIVPLPHYAFRALAVQGSNLKPSESKSDALPIELTARWRREPVSLFSFYDLDRPRRCNVSAGIFRIPAHLRHDVDARLRERFPRRTDLAAFEVHRPSVS